MSAPKVQINKGADNRLVNLFVLRKADGFSAKPFDTSSQSQVVSFDFLSVIAEPKPSRGSYGTWLGEGKPSTVRGRLECLIDTALGQGCKDFDSFLTAMKAAGVEVKRGKHLAFKIPNGKRFVRCDSLGDDYTEMAIMERISGKRIVTPKAKTAIKSKPNLLIDIQAKMQQIHSPGFERWAKIFNLKEMAKTVMYLQENNLTDLGELEKACDAAVQRFNDLADQTKAANARMKDIEDLERHIGTYSKTREIYMQYRKLTGRKQAKFYEQHSSEITACQAAKRYFNSLGLKKLPSMQLLKQEYAKLQAENKKRYPEYKQAGVWGWLATNKHAPGIYRRIACRYYRTRPSSLHLNRFLAPEHQIPGLRKTLPV